MPRLIRQRAIGVERDTEAGTLAEGWRRASLYGNDGDLAS
jgi:hypothetical protein